MSPSFTHLQASAAPLLGASSSAYRCGPMPEEAAAGRSHARIAAVLLDCVLLDCIVRTPSFANGPEVKA